ncbi:hypothetical protein MNBD_DELTA03-715 [hydrothermal vent metagenome]|uniref:Ancillary SecYEG translocon subunit/Cell division coordinator CpoB TPR domain-containing protein n=1 Tax=hydrothermal vent metagenome TaxID=652676 RepID=A0A3B0VCC8_9ZZZZ
MAAEDVFHKKHEDVVAKDKKAILEELNLPPVVIEFFRKNETMIKVGLVILVVLVLGGEGYQKYTANQAEKSSAMLYSALQSTDMARESKILGKLSKKYSHTGSALWADIELGHVAFKKGDFSQAADFYSKALARISDTHPMYPLVLYSLAQAYENMDKVDKAKDAFLKLTDINGFIGEGDLGLARIYEKHGDPAQALTYYQEYIKLPETQPGAIKNWVMTRIAQLQK